jgi:hypothetical protein
VLAPSQRYHLKKGKRHKTPGDWARQIAMTLHRWLPDFQCIITADGTYAIMELLASTRRHVTWITRFRLDAALFDFPPPYKIGQKGRPFIKGSRQPSLRLKLEDPTTEWKKVCFSLWYGEENKEMEIASEKAIWYRAGKPAVPLRWVLVRDAQGKHDPLAILCTDLESEPFEIVRDFVKRWQVEVTFEEVRAQLGVETQRQWSDQSIARTTPVLMALFSLVTLWADQLNTMQKLTIFQTAWYKKPYPTFSDAVASVRYRIWRFQLISHSGKNTECKKIKRLLIEQLAYQAARAA